MTGARPTRGQLALFSGPCLPLAAVGLPLVVHLPTFYTTHIGLGLTTVGVAFMVVRLLDIAVDPVLGALMDRTRTRFGRFRPWLVASAPVLMAACLMLFMAEPGVGPAYLVAGLLLAYGGWSMAVLSQTSWGATLSPDYGQRSRVFGWWQAANVVGLILALVTPVLAARFDPGPAAGVRAMGWFVILTLPLAVGAAALWLREPPAPAERSRAGVSDWLAMLRSPAVRRLLWADLILGFTPGVAGALFLFFFRQAKGFEAAEANLLLLAYFVAALAGAPLWTRLSVKIGKHRALAAASLFYVVGLGGLFVLPAGAMGAGVLAAAVAGLPYSAASILLRAMMADIADEERLERGADRTGLLYAVLVGTTKVGTALAVGVTFVGLDLAGFDPRGVNEGAALVGLQALFLGLPAVFSLLAAAILLGYPLDAARHAGIRAALAQKDAKAP